VNRTARRLEGNAGMYSGGEALELEGDVEGRAGLCRILLSRYLVPISAGTSAILTEVLHVFSQSLHAITGIVLRVIHDSYLPDPSQFIILQACYHSTLCSVATDIVINNPQRKTNLLVTPEMCCARVTQSSPNFLFITKYLLFCLCVAHCG
jgi:hypothetical protein